MKSRWQAVTIGGALFIAQIVFMGVPRLVLADLVLIGDIIPNLTYTLMATDTIIMASTDTITLTQDLNISGTLEAAGKILVPNLNVLSGGILDITEPVEVGGNLVMSLGSNVELGVRPKVGPSPQGDGDDVLAAFLEEYSEFASANHDVYEVSSAGQLVVSSYSGMSGTGLVALGFRPAPQPGPPGDDELIFGASSILFQNGSTLNFNFLDGYTPTIGDMVSLSDISFTIGSGVNTNLPQGWVLMNSAATIQYIGSPVPEPATMLLFGTGLLGLLGCQFKRRKKK